MKYGLVIVTILAMVAVAGRFLYDAQERKYQERVEHVQEFADEQKRRAEAALATADSLKAERDSVAAVAARRDTVVRERVREVLAEPVPEDCAEFVLPRDSLISDLLGQVNLWREAYDAAAAEAEALRGAHGRLVVAVDSLQNVLNDRPKPKPAWIPEIKVGAIAGICLDGPCIGAGVSLGWEIPIP